MGENTYWGCMIIRELFTGVDREQLLQLYNQTYYPQVDLPSLNSFLDSILALPVVESDKLLVKLTKRRGYVGIAGFGFDQYDSKSIHYGQWDIEWRPAVEVLGYHFEDHTGDGLSEINIASLMLEELGVYLGHHRV